ncbi:SGNH/GDSL hydrolase family protein [Asticcacaulis sp. EMRT-3]|uniref:SGNH/GDSL hydrolase family protein n=1 Tax=Asticcacaulis sp. EMRT-3 TaxID=3040349 RepID=UPI0024AF0A5D|nr:SGNH/GDSL hydrolase family protein [Asticcacaulis sp. EMRT-3]MDI7775060.1 SGNH/GDSL hydrolase family protein [Asticcacaulis sp. EMRT-3]
MKKAFPQAFLNHAVVASAVSLLALGLAAGAAHAQAYDRLVSFGDSLTDNGNLYLATGNPPAPYNHRYTNDRTFAEYLSGDMLSYFTPPAGVNSGSINFAWGGARADNAANSNGPIPSVYTQIQTFVAEGGKFGANDVTSLWAGANDLFQALPGAAANPATAQATMTTAATTAAGTVVTEAGMLAGAGAKTLLVINLPNLGAVPQFNTDANTSALTGYTGETFNAALHVGLGQVAAQATGSNIIEVDVFSALNAIAANPQAYGFTDVSHACIMVSTCVTGSMATQNNYLFWDGVHPTAAGHRLIANLTAQYLYTPTLTEGVAMFADESYESRRATAAEMAGLLHDARAGGYFVQIVGTQGTRNRTVGVQSMIGGDVVDSSARAYDFNQSGLRGGMMVALSDTSSLGFGVTAVTGDTEAFMVRAKATDISVDAAYDWHSGPVFVTAAVGAGAGSYADYERATLFGPYRNSRGHIGTSAYSASLQAGIDHQVGRWTVTPLARLSYVTATMQGFDEFGTIAAVGFDDRKVSATNGAVELRAKGQLTESVALNGVIGYEGTLSGDEGDLRGQLLNNTAQPFATAMGNVESPGVLAGIGLTTKLGGFDVSAQYRGTYGSKKQKNQTALLSISKAF